MAFQKKKSTGPTYQSIVTDLKAGQLRPVYYLMGTEAYYIDRLCDIITQVAVPEEEDRDFNLMTFYGPDTTTDTVITAARGVPMMGERLLIVVKEAQALRDIDKLEYYLRQPADKNVIVFCHKNGSLDRRKKVAGLIDKAGVLFESLPPDDRQLLSFITDYSRQKHIELEPRAVQMMAEYIGADLMRMAGEIDKLAASLQEGETKVTADRVSDQIGVSRQFNINELLDAIAAKNVPRTMEIVNFIDKNQKTTPIQMVLPSLFRLFANVMQAHYAPVKTEQGIAEATHIHPYAVRVNVMPAMRNYNALKCMNIISAIRKTDARSKGVDNPETPPEELMRELVYFILH